MKITVINGTNRRGNKTIHFSRLVEKFHQALGAETTLVTLEDLPLELLHPDAYANRPLSFEPFSDAVLGCDGLVIVVPEYNGSMPGALKLFIDFLKYPDAFEGKPVCFAGLAAGQWGGLRPVEHLQQIFGYRNAHVFPRRVFIPGANRLMSDAGELLDAEVSQRLQQQAKEFQDYIRRFGNPEIVD